MKKIVAIAAIILAITAAYVLGRSAGIRHAVEDSVIFTVECYDPENPYENARDDGTDQTIWIELDGETYEHGMFQG